MKKIMFSDRFGLTQAALEGRKTQTRRIITHPKTFHGKDVCGFYVYKRVTDGVVTDVCMYDENESSIDEGQIFPKYKIDEVVAVAQSYKDCGYSEIALDRSPKDFRIVRGTLRQSKGWKNKMFVRADACKHQIRITNVRIQRLKDISDEDCLKEGIQKMPIGCEYLYSFYDNDKGVWNNYKTPRKAFSNLINKVSRKDVWNDNPYVFVYDFELIKGGKDESKV